MKRPLQASKVERKGRVPAAARLEQEAGKASCSRVYVFTTGASFWSKSLIAGLLFVSFV
jgi:hypothetical protein